MFKQKVSSQKFVFTLISPGETSALIEIERDFWVKKKVKLNIDNSSLIHLKVTENLVFVKVVPENLVLIKVVRENFVFTKKFPEICFSRKLFS